MVVIKSLVLYNVCMNGIEFEDDDKVSQHDTNTKDTPAICPHCSFPMIPDDDGICPRCHYSLPTPSSDVSLDKRFPKWSAPRIMTPLHTVGLKIWQELLLFAALCFGAPLIGQTIFAILEYGFHYQTTDFDLGLINLALLSFGLISATFIIFKNLKPFGLSFFSKGRSLRTIVIGIKFAAIMILASAVYGMIQTGLFELMGITEAVNANQGAIDGITESAWWLSAILVVFMAPVVEELAYRLGLYSLLKRKNKWLALIATATVFGAIHFNWFAFDVSQYGIENLMIELVNLPSYIIAGLILCLAYDEWGIGASTIAHMSYNAFVLITSLLLSLLPNQGANPESAFGVFLWI